MKLRPKSNPKIKCVLRTDDPNVCKFILNYKTKRKSREMTLDLSVLASQTKLLADLMRANADLPKKVVDRKKLVLELIERGTSNVPELRVTKRSGFSRDGQFVLPDMTISNTKPDIFHEAFFGEPDPYQNLKGSVDEWKELLGPACERSNLLVFGILVALTGPLLHCFDPDIGIAFNLAGPSGTGKSTLMRVAQSVLRRADSTDIPTLNGTLTGVEELAYDSNDTFFCLDEFGTSLRSDKKAKEILPFVSYVLCGGVGRRRAKSAAANMGYSHRKWRATLFTASEMPLHEMIGSRFPGEEVRLVEISVPPPSHGGIFDMMGDAPVSQLATKKLAHEAENAIAQNYGHAFRAFVRYLLEGGRDYGARARRIQGQFVQGMIDRGYAAETDTRLLDVFGKVAATAALADKAGVLPVSKKQAIAATMYAFSRTTKAKEHANELRRDALQALFGLAADDMHCFRLRKGQKIPEHLRGKLKAITKDEKGRKLLCVLPDCFKALVGPMNAPSILADLETAGVVIKTGQNKTRQVKVEGLTEDSRPRLFCLDLANLRALLG